MPNRETWDWQGLEPDQTVIMTMLFARTPKDDGRKEGADYDWHRYPVSVEKTDWTMFTPSEFMHSALQALGVDKKGDIFRATKKLGYNKDTGKSYTYYELERDGTKLRTDQMEQPQRIVPQEPPNEAVQNLAPDEIAEPTPKKLVPPNKATLKEIHREAYTAVMDNILEYLWKRCPALYAPSKSQDETQTQEKMHTLIVDLQPYISSMVNTLVMGNGDRK